MAGLFGGGKNDEPKGAYYLEPDDAKTLGDIEYMRTPNTVEHKFPGLAGGKGFAVKKVITAMEVQEEGKSKAAPAPAVTPEISVNSDRPRRVNDDMDIFRKMAKEIKK